jgi:predicted branched-subunit amino acid permease
MNDAASAPARPRTGERSLLAAFWQGYRDCAPFILITVPYSMMFGVIARDAGLDVAQTMAMSVAVIAGASQFTAVALMQDHAPVLVILLTSLAVNLRLAMYSAALVPYLGHAPLWQRGLMSYLMVDQAFAVAVRTYEAEPDMGPRARVAYYFGVMVLICPVWYACTFAGAVFGTSLPASLSLAVAVPVCFVALVAPLLRTGPHRVAAMVSVAGALAFSGLPWSLGTLAASLAAILAGGWAERYLQRQARVAG